MAKGPRIFDSSNLENWYLYNEQFRRQQGVRLLTDAPECREFLWHFRPYTLEYTSSLNPIFLAEVPNLEALKSRKTWLVRDGLVPLLWFFRNYPKPLDLASRLLVHESMTHVVPSAWQKNIGTYRVVNRVQKGIHSRKEPARFLFSGIITDSIVSMDVLRNRLKNLHARFGTEVLRKAEKVLVLFVRQDVYNPEDQSAFQMQFLMEMADSLGTKFQFLNLDELKTTSDLSGCYYADWNDGRLISDIYLTHLCLSKGGQLLDIESEKPLRGNKSEYFVSLSPYHGMMVNERIRAGARPQIEIDAEIERIMMSNCNQRYPWPRWLVEWSQESARS